MLEVAAGASLSFDALGRILHSEDNIIVALACSSIAGFCDQYQASPLHDSAADPFPRQMVVSYRCDGCDLCPIEDTRFTYEARGVDLCDACHTEADRYASQKSYSSSVSVLIAGKRVGGLQCNEMKLMQAVAAKGETLQRQQLFDEFLEHLFSHVIDVATKVGTSNPSLISLLLAICHQSSDNEKVARLAKVLTSGLFQAMSTDPRNSKDAVFFINALSKLAVWDDGAAYCIAGSDKGLDDDQGLPGVESPRCHAHGLKARCRIATHSPNVGRRYFCCSKEAKAQCTFFQWEDDPNESEGHFNEAASKVVWAELQQTLDDLCKWISSDGGQQVGGGRPSRSNDSVEADTLAGAFCSRHRLRDVRPEDFVSLRAPRFRSHSSRDDDDVGSALLQLLALVASPKGNAAVTWSPFLCHMISSRGGAMPEASSLAAKRALLLMCGSRSRYVAVRAHFSFSINRDRLVMEAGVLVLSAFAVKERARQCGSDWKRHPGREVAGLLAGDLLGADDLISEDVTTSSRLEEVRKILSELAAVAKKRPDHWSTFCGLVSLPDTRFVSVPESLQQVLKISPVVTIFVLSLLLRGDVQLRAFQLIDVALSSTPTMQQKKAGAASREYPLGTEMSSSAEDLNPARILQLTIPQAVAFVARFGCGGGTSDLRHIACSIIWKLFLRSDSRVQSELFGKLVPVALSLQRSTGKSCLELLRVSSFVLLSEFTPICVCSSRTSLVHHLTAQLLQRLLAAAASDHVDAAGVSARILLAWKHQMRAMAKQRSEGSNRYELSPCCHCMNAVMIRRSEKRLSASALPSTSTDGTPPPGGTKDSSIRVSAISKAWLPEQFTVSSRGRLEGWRDTTCSDEFNMYSSFKYRLVLSEVHVEISDPRGRFVKTISFFFSPRPVTEVTELKAADYQGKWQPCGSVTLSKGASRGSFKLPRPVVAANLRVEYTSFYERPGGSKPSDGSFVIHCPRCKFLDFEFSWMIFIRSFCLTVCAGRYPNCYKCAWSLRKLRRSLLSMPKGAFVPHKYHANHRFYYDGTDTLSLCGCFQCRHINYDRLDAFLCVECGYCASGSFTYELTAAIASNAVAIRDDVDYERSCRMLAIATRLHEDLQSELRERLDETFSKAGDRGIDVRPDLPEPVRRVFAGALPLLPGEVEDAASASLSLHKMGKPGSVVKAVARSDRPTGTAQSLGSPIMNRTHSLLRLTREWRESASRGRAVGGSDGTVLIHHLGRSESINFDRSHPMMMDEGESNELFGLLEGAAAAAAAASSGRGSGNDPLSRLLATMQNRRERRAAADAGGSAAAPAARDVNASPNVLAAGAPGDGSRSAGNKESADICDRLYALMREAEREAYFLRQRVSAWRNLESDALLLGDSETAQGPPPRVCSTCAPPVALHLLQLWLLLFKQKPDQVHITSDVIQLLCREDTIGPAGPKDDKSGTLQELEEAKRQALKEIALRAAPPAPGLVLDALRLRLLATQCVRCSEILASIVEAGGPKPFYDLAVEVLEFTSEV